MKKQKTKDKELFSKLYHELTTDFNQNFWDELQTHRHGLHPKALSYFSKKLTNRIGRRYRRGTPSVKK